MPKFYKYKDDPTIYSEEGRGFSSPEQFFAAGGMRDFSNVETKERPIGFTRAEGDPTVYLGSRAFATPEQFFAAGGMRDFSNVQVNPPIQTGQTILDEYFKTPQIKTVGTSEAERATKRKAEIEKIKGDLNLGEPPTLASMFGETEKTNLVKARQERDLVNVELEKLQAESLALEDEFAQFKRKAGEGRSEAGRIGTIVEEERSYLDRKNVLNRQAIVLETKFNNRNSVIRELMQLQRQDYADAVNQYNTKFTQALQLYKVLDEERDELTQNAKANLDVMANALGGLVQTGQLTVDQITGLQRAKIEEFEAQAGLPIGSTILSLATLKPKETVQYKGVDKLGNYNEIVKQADGSLKVRRIEGALPPEPVELSPGQRLVDPKTGKVIASVPYKGTGTDTGNDIDDYAQAVFSGSLKLNQVPIALRGAVDKRVKELQKTASAKYDSEFEARLDYEQEIQALEQAKNDGELQGAPTEIIKALFNAYSKYISKQEIEGTVLNLFGKSRPDNRLDEFGLPRATLSAR